ncbi:MAG: toll/interleukin-1 receptor domain-containing protein, partial [Streptosporangiaceae bacterium]
DFVDKIGDGIRQSQVVMVFLSKAALESFWVKREWTAQLIRMARDRTVRLLPILLPGVDEDQLNPLLQVEHRLDFRTVDLGDPDVLEHSVSTIIENLRGNLPSLGSPTIGLPFVIFAMNSAEAAALQSGEVFDDPSVAPIERTAFQSLLEELKRNEMPDLSSYYSEFREDWRPPIAGGISARHAIFDVIDRVNMLRQDRPDSPLIRPQFFSEDFLSDDVNWRATTWASLSRLGCICVVDALSLFHPALRTKLERSEFGSSERASFVFMFPMNPHRLPISLIVEEQIRSHLPRAFDRFDSNLDLLCELSAPDIRHVKRWLFSVLPEVALKTQGERPLLAQRLAMREMVRDQTQAAQKIFGWQR